MAAQPLDPQTEPLAEAPNNPILPSWRLPYVRRDKEARLALLMRNILYQHEIGGCAASNHWLAKSPALGLGVDVATVRRGLADLEACGLIIREFDALGQRTIRPLVTAAELIGAGWKALARAIVGLEKWPALLRAQCRRLLDLPRNCAGSARPGATIARPLRVEERKAQKTTDRRAVVVPPAETPDPEAVKLAVDAGVPERAVRESIAGKPLSAVKRALRLVAGYRARKKPIHNLPGLFRAALTNAWEPPAPPSVHPSDRGERPQRIVVVIPRAESAETNRTTESDAANRAWESLSESEKGELLRAALAEVLSGDSESEKAQARRRGIDSAFVEIRAKRLARERLCAQ